MLEIESVKANLVKIAVDDQSEKSDDLVEARLTFDIRANKPFCEGYTELMAIRAAHEILLEEGYHRGKTLMPRKYEKYAYHIKVGKGPLVVVDGDVIGAPYMQTQAKGDPKKFIRLVIRGHISRAEADALVGMVAKEVDLKVDPRQAEMEFEAEE